MLKFDRWDKNIGFWKRSISISSVSWNTALTMNESLLLNGKSCAQSGNTRTHLVCRIAMEEMLDRSLLGNAPNRLLGVSATGRLLINVSPVGTHFDTYFGRYKGLLCRYVLDPIFSFLLPSDFNSLSYRWHGRLNFTVFGRR